MVTALRYLFAMTRRPGHEEKERAVQTLSSILEQARAIGHAHATEGLERGVAWGGNFGDSLNSAWGIVNTFVQRILDWISGQDEATLTDKDIEAEVEALAETVGDTEVASAIEEAVMEELTAQGATQVVWFASGNACRLCIENAVASPLPRDTDWPSGDRAPPAHPRCRCSIGVPYGS